MNAPVRVMIVDDSAVVRRMLTGALANHPEVEVVGSASNGVIALSKIPQLNPELVILDVEMPEMDGIAMLGALRSQYPRLPVIMFSTLTERGANVTFDALAAGADDYVLKPSTQTGETLDGIVSKALVPKILGLTRSRIGLALQAALSAANDIAGNEGKVNALKRAEPAGAINNPFARPVDTFAGKYTLRTPGADANRASAVRPIDGFGSEPNTARRGLAPKAPAGASPFGAPSRPSGIPPAPVVPPSRPSMPASDSAFGGLGRDRKFDSLPTQVQRPQLSPQAGAQPTANLNAARKPVQVIVIAASTGGPNALAELLPRLPKSCPVPIVVVQHMPPIFTRCLADRLGARCELKVVESQGGERLAPGQIVIAPGNRHLELSREGDGIRTVLTDAPPENSCRPAADVTMSSLVRAYGGGILGVVLTGMGHDGLRGAREIREAGGRVLVQSGPSCVVWGMPKAVEEAGLADAVVPLSELAAAILQRVGNGLLPALDPERRR